MAWNRPSGSASLGRAAPDTQAAKYASHLTLCAPSAIRALASGDVLQGAAADCNSAGETHAWFDSRVAHHSPLKLLGFWEVVDVAEMLLR